MRLFEILILATALIALFGYSIPAGRRPRAVTYIPSLGVTFVILHLLVEGFRWQMSPAIALTLVLFGVATGQALGLRLAPFGSLLMRRLTAAVCLLAAMLLYLPAVAIPVAIPVFRLPAPTGPYAVGTTSMSLIDRSRPEIITEEPDDYRELVISIWYPATTSPEMEPVPYFPEYREVGEILAGILKLPWFCFDHMRLVTSNSYLDAPLVDDQDRFPVVVFNSGIFAGMVTQNTILMEELASHGYIAISVAHSYECLAAIHPDGRVVTVDINRQDAFWAETEKPDAKTLRRIYSTCLEPEEQRQLLEESMAALPLVNESVDIWVADLSFVLDELTALDAGYRESPFQGRLDIDHVGVVGMSFGGTVAMEACRRDPRFRAGLNLEGQPLGMQVQEPYPVPFMHMRQANETYPLDMAYETAIHPIYRVTFTATRHLNFTDASIMAPIFGKKMGFVGAADGSLMLSRINAFAVTFFDRHLKNLDAPFPAVAEPDRDPIIFESQNVDLPPAPQETVKRS